MDKAGVNNLEAGNLTDIVANAQANSVTRYHIRTADVSNITGLPDGATNALYIIITKGRYTSSGNIIIINHVPITLYFADFSSGVIGTWRKSIPSVL